MVRHGYQPLTEPSPEYCRSLATAAASSFPESYGASCLKSVGSSAQQLRSPRLFAHDMVHRDHSDGGDAFFAALDPAYRSVRDEAALAKQRAKLSAAALQASLLAGVQMSCGAILALNLIYEGRNEAGLFGTSAILVISGLCGLVGSLRRSSWALEAYFLTQIVVLAVTAAQWLRSQQAARKTALFCAEHTRGIGSKADACDTGHLFAQVSALLIGLGVVYASMFSMDRLTERLQDEREQADNRRVLEFSSEMHQSTLAGVKRFEDRIHMRFEELVRDGFLKPRGSTGGGAIG